MFPELEPSKVLTREPLHNNTMRREKKMITYQDKNYKLLENKGQPIHQMAGVYIELATIDNQRYALIDGEFAREL